MFRIKLCVLIIATAVTPLSAGEPAPTPAPSEATLPPPPAAAPKEPAPSGSPPMAADVLDFTNPAYLIELANAHLKFNALDRAEPLLRTALEKSKIDAQKATICQLLASLLERKNDRKGAVAQYEAAYALVVNPNERGRLGISLADAYIRADDLDKAERFALDASKPNKLRTDDQWIQQNAIRILTQLWQGKPERIDAFAAEAEAELKKNPNNMVVLQQLVEIYTGVKHDAAKAATYEEKLCAIRPADKTLQFKLANLYQQSGQIDKAIEVNRKLVASSTARKEDQLFQVGMLMLQQGQKDEAAAWMKENYAKTISAPHDYFMLAMFYEKADKPGDAASALWQIVDAPGSSTEEKADARMRIGELAFRMKDYAKAEEGAQAVLKDFAGTNLVARAKLLLKQIEAQKKKDTDSKPATPEKKDVKPVLDGTKDSRTEEPAGASGSLPPPQK